MSSVMSTIETLRARLPEYARDIKLNLQSVLQPGGTLSTEQRWGVAVASGGAPRHSGPLNGPRPDAPGQGPAAGVGDAAAAAAAVGGEKHCYPVRHPPSQPAV